MKSEPARGFFLVPLVFIAVTVGCGKSAESPVAEQVSAPASVSDASAPTATITATPNPIQVCDGSGLGVTHLSWSAPVGVPVQVRVGKPDGTLFASTGNAGEKDTGKWVSEGAKFFLVRIASPGGSPSVLGSTVVHVTKEGCR